VVIKVEPEAPKPAPKAEVKGDRVELKERVEFELNSATILPQSHAMLDEVVQIMADHPEIKKIRVEGHTDNTGKREHNQKLSDERAASVKTYLSDHGVNADRLVSRGFGQDRPLTDNGTEEGRAKNRRVEIQILERQ